MMVSMAAPAGRKTPALRGARAWLCFVALTLAVLSWHAAPGVPMAEGAGASRLLPQPEDKTAGSSTPSRDFIRSSLAERAVSSRPADPAGDEWAAGLAETAAFLSPPNGIEAAAFPAAQRLAPSRHIRPAATGPPDAAQALPA